MTERPYLLIGAAVAVLILILAWVWWPAPGPSPAEEALKAQNEALVKANEKLTAEAVAKTEEAKSLREEADAKLNEIPVLRTARRTARRDGATRRDVILATPDERAADALRAQHERTRERLRDVRAGAEPAESDSRTSEPR